MKKLIFALMLVVLLSPLTNCSKREPTRAELYRKTLPREVNVLSSLSMKGYHPGDKLIVSAGSYSQIKTGDHVFVWYDGADLPYFHLAVRKVYSAMPPHDRWLVHGDNNDNNDERLMTEDTYIGTWEATNK